MPTSANWSTPVLRNRLVVLILSISLFVPLVITPICSRYPAVGAALIEGCAILLLAMLLWRVDWRAGRARAVEFCRAGANLPILAFFTLAGVSCLLSPEKTFSTQELLRIGSGVVLYFALAYHVRRSDHLMCLVDVILFLCCAIALSGFIQFDSSTGKAATGLFIDHQLYGSALMALLPIAAAVAVTEKNPKRQLAARAATVLAATGLLIAHSRSAWVGCSVGLLVLAAGASAFAMRKHGANLRYRLHEVLLPVALLLIAIGFFLFMWPHTGAIMTRATTLSSISRDITWRNRQAAWKGALAMIARKPLTGHGLGLYPVYQNHYTGVGNPVDTLKLHTSLSDQAHNLYLQTAAELGLPGLALFLAIPAVFLVAGTRKALQMDEGIRRTLLLGSIAGVIACLVDAYSSPSWQIGEVSLFLWLLLGVGVSCMLPKVKRAARETTVAAPRYLAGRRALSLASLALAALLPTAVASANPTYTFATMARIEPHDKPLKGGLAQMFHLYVTFGPSMGSPFSEEREVTYDAATTTFTFMTTPTANVGYLTGPNNSTYQSVVRKVYTAKITGTFHGGSNNATLSDTATLNITP